jgi:hypothetical protein
VFPCYSKSTLRRCMRYCSHPESGHSSRTCGRWRRQQCLNKIRGVQSKLRKRRSLLHTLWKLIVVKMDDFNGGATLTRICFGVSIPPFSQCNEQRCMLWERIQLRYVSRFLERSERGNRCSKSYLPRANCCETVKLAKPVAAANRAMFESIVRYSPRVRIHGQ